MSTTNTTFTTGTGNTVNVSGVGGPYNLNYTMNYGGFNGTVSIDSNMKNVFYASTPREVTVLEEASNYLTNKSQVIGGLYQNTANLAIEFVGDRYYQDAEASKAFKDIMAQHEAQLLSPGHNDFGIDVAKILKNVIPLDLKPIADAVSSVSATPDDLKPLPPATSIWNLAEAIAIATENQVKIEKATLEQQLKAIADAQIEHAEAQNDATMEEMKEDGEEGVLEMLSNGLTSLFGSYITPETKHSDSYSITDDILYDGLSPYFEEGGLETERNI